MEVSLADGCLEGSEKDLCISALSMLGSRRGRQQVSEDPATKLSFCSKMPSCRFLTPAPPFTFCQADRCDLLVYLYRTKAGRKMHGLRPPMRLQTNMLREVLSPNRANSNACLKDSLGKHSNTMPLCNTQKLSIYKYKEIDRTSPCGPIGSPRIDSFFRYLLAVAEAPLCPKAASTLQEAVSQTTAQATRKSLAQASAQGALESRSEASSHQVQ